MNSRFSRLLHRPFWSMLFLCAALPTVSASLLGQDPAATITHIETAGSDSPAAEILRIESGERIAAGTGMDLFDGDEIQTGPTTTVKLLFLQNVLFEDKTAIIDPDTHVIIDTPSSLFAYVGRVFMQFAGYFDFKLSDRTLGGGGTEFQVEVAPDGSVELLVIEGDVGLYPFRLPLGEELPGRDLPSDVEDPPNIDATLTSGKSARARKTIAFNNQCQQPHTFLVEAKSGLPWAGLSSSAQVELEPGQSGPVTLEVEIDARGIVAGLYRADFNNRCLDCDLEPGCGGQLAPTSFFIQVRPPLQAEPLETASLEPGSQLPQQTQAAEEEEVRAALQRTSEIIVKTQPPLPEARILPTFENPEERAEAFTQARFKAYWERDAEAFETMGHIYGEWGRGARALKAYTQATRLDEQRLEDGQFLMRWGRANRQVGNLERADELLQASLEKDPDSAPARNERGALYLDWAKRARQQGDPAQASLFLENAITFFSQSTDLLEEDGQEDLDRSITRVNEAEANLELATVRRQVGDLTEAGVRVGAARAILESVNVTPDEYPQASIALGESYLQQGQLRLATAASDPSALRGAAADFEQARRQFNEAASRHPDLAAAYAGMAEVAAASGSREEAVQLHQRALAANPRYAPSYGRLAELLGEDEPERARRYRDIYDAFLPKAVRPEPRTPRLIGLNLEQSRRALAQGRFELGTVEYQPSQQADGTVIEQSPEPGSRLRPSQSVNLVLAGPREPVAVPRVEGMAYPDAVQALERAGFKVGTVIEKKSRKPEGTVHDQDPEGGSKRLVGSAIDLEIAVATEPGKARVPRLRGMDRRQAREAIEAAGFTLGRSTEKESRERPGTVIDQKPDAGKERKEGSRIDIEIAVPRQIKVPGLVNTEVERAQRKLSEEGLRVGRIDEAVSCDSLGRVISQRPEKGGRLSAGQAVDLVVGGLGPNPVRVVDLRGQPQDIAQRRLQDQGLRLSRVRQRETDQFRPGTVLEQIPGPGAMLPSGCPVEILVARAIPHTIVPNLVGLSSQDVQRSLSQAQLRTGRVEYEQSYARSGSVLRQSPPPGSRVRPGSAVHLVVAAPPAPQPLRMPELRRKSLREAAVIIEGNGLRLGQVMERQAAGLQPGTVLDQRPAAGSLVQPGSVVTLVVSSQASTPQLPDLTVQVRQTGNVVQRSGGVLIPVQVTVRNQGGSPASGFKNSFHYSASSQGLASFQVNRQTTFYVNGPSSLPPNRTFQFQGSIYIRGSFQGQVIHVWVKTDSCSGDEFMPNHCRVEESNEGNNDSNRLSFKLPIR
ncbi:MAG TPA: PASTA domain-containing protein [Acidobacteriota bacterium]|nr:PASTA domain-containing protein [Acidobacteriota bacterium]